MSTMKALIFDKELELVNDFQKPGRAPGESLIRVIMAGICNTDLEILKGYMDFRGIIGHEFVGIVEETDRGDLRGKRVVGEINSVCGSCVMCRRGLANHCLNRTVLGISGRNGVFAEYVLLPDENLHIVPDSVPDEVAVFAEPLAAAFRITQEVHVLPTDTALVLGDGKLGQLVARVFKGTHCDLLVAGKSGTKFEFLRAAGIASVQESKIKHRNFADIVVECTGVPEGLPRALELVRPQGIVVLKSTYAGMAQYDISSLVLNEVSFVSSRCGPFDPAIRALTDKSINPIPLITGVFPFKEAIEAFELSQVNGALKIILKM